ncbi:hypothetical protein GGR88_002649 [Sphingomonas jejuensis]|uniref:Ice-binding protein C-terminal domain-containing protein n=1 Tax=Sphingomonas jejuensis TaxID=904715 RepID=A0ABX0XR48_9SPHN|nr:PEPxxWA-CTERM sorting domain-containing protein [Sphingomonas jejuensis]NJC35135.1 hypothetical protein [Sphingomonas jejuensis]
MKSAILFAGLGLSTGLLSTPAVAAPVLCSTGSGINLVSTGCYASGNDSESAVEAAIRAATGITTDITLYGKSDDNAGLFAFNPVNPANTQSGTWDVLNNSVLISFVSVKAANNFAVYQLGGSGANSGSYSSSGLLTNNGRNQADVSHLSFWTARVAAVPEPATWAMMIAGFGLVGGAMRRRIGAAVTA